MSNEEDPPLLHEFSVELLNERFETAARFEMGCDDQIALESQSSRDDPRGLLRSPERACENAINGYPSFAESLSHAPHFVCSSRR